MSGPMPKDELQSHRRIISEFLADWGYILARGAILPAQFKYSNGLKIDFENAMTITDHPHLGNSHGQTSEYFLRDCLETEHESLWKTVRSIFVDENGGCDNMRHWDGNRLAQWAWMLEQDDTKAVSGSYVQKSHDTGCRVGFCGSISGKAETLHIEHGEVKIKTTLPTTMLESINMQHFGELFEGLPQCSDETLNKEIAGMYVTKACQDGKWVVFDMLDGRATPMPPHNPDDLWRRIRDNKPDTIFLQFPPHGTIEDMNARAATHRTALEDLLRQLPDKHQDRFLFPPMKAAA